MATILISTPPPKVRGAQHRASPLLQEVGGHAPQSTHVSTATHCSVLSNYRDLIAGAGSPGHGEDRQASSQDCKFVGSFSVWGQTYFEYYYTAIACYVAIL